MTRSMNIYHQLYKRPSLIEQHITAPLFKERLEYLQHCAASHIVPTSLMRIAHFMLETVKFLNLKKARIVRIEEIESAATAWVKKRKYIRKRTGSNVKISFIYHTVHWLKSMHCLAPLPEERVALLNSLFEMPQTLKRHVNAPLKRVMHFSIEWLKFINCLSEIKPFNQPFQFQLNLEKYIHYMRVEKTLSEETINGSSHVNKQFLIHVGKTKKLFSEITPLTIDEFLIKKHDVDGCSRVTIQEYASEIRSFLRYAVEQSWCHKNLADSIRAPRVYNHESLPLSPSWDDVKKILSHCKKNDSPMNIRDYAILLLLSVYGMRRGEVAHLRLDDIDWSNELIYLKRVKKTF